MNFSHFLAIIKSRFLLLMVTFVITVGCAAALTFMEPKRYTAASYLVLSFKEESPFETTIIPAQLSADYLETQLDVIRSQNVAVKVCEQLKLDKDPNWISAYKSADAPMVPIRNWIALQIATNLSVDPLPNSHVVSLTYSAGDPADAARYANAYVAAFLATTLELTVDKARRNADWFDEQLKVLRKRLETARARMTEFQVQNGIVALDEKLAAETTRLNDISKDLVEAQSSLYDARSRQLGTNHPEYVRALQHESALRSAMERQKHDILQLKGLRDELDARSNEVESEQQNYSATLQTYYKATMESQLSQSNISVLSLATTPQDPSSPNVVLNMVSAIVLGLILGLLVAVGAEMIDPRVRIPEGPGAPRETL